MKVDELGDLLALDRLAAQLDEIHGALGRSLAFDNDFITVPASRVVRAAGKHLRPVLAIASAVAGTGRFGADVVAGATALELMHVGSLVHDDIIDNAGERRGVRTINAVEGTNHAILVGDFLLARAAQLAAHVNAPVAVALADALAELCAGQSLEEGFAFDPSRTVANYERTIAGKTAALLRASCEIGALCGRVPDEAVAALRRFGQAFGMAFQIVDDVLDLASTAAALGKPVGSDIRAGVYTLPLLLLLERPAGRDVRVLLRSGIGGDEVERIVGLLWSEGTITAALDRAQAYNREAAEALDPLPDTPTAAGLRALPDAYVRWAVREKAPVLAVA